MPKPNTKSTRRPIAIRNDKPGECKYTIEEAFDYYTGPADREEHPRFNDDRAIRAVAYLLSYSSDAGNLMLDGNLANGLGQMLNLAAERVAFNAKNHARRSAESRLA